MSIVFSDTTTNLGIVQQVRDTMRVDSTQWATSKIVNSCNNYLDTVAGYAIGAVRRLQWDDTNHTKLPIGTTNLIANQAEYSFLTDEQGNAILNLTRIDILDPSGLWRELKVIDEAQIPIALDEFEKTAGFPQFYDKTADNIIKLYPKPATSVTSGLKFYFQRTPSYFAATDTTKAPGVPPLLHRGFVINSAYDGAMTLGLGNKEDLFRERQIEQEKMTNYFMQRNTDEVKKMYPRVRSSR